ncbi:hypothetical protein AQZ49_16525 [Novosphingobium sp. FSW06-99]|nr:hypothetical protein AQZ49_16525 [Novosphingobium sp. FSW06-99]
MGAQADRHRPDAINKRCIYNESNCAKLDRIGGATLAQARGLSYSRAMHLTRHTDCAQRPTPTIDQAIGAFGAGASA